MNTVLKVSFEMGLFVPFLIAKLVLKKAQFKRNQRVIVCGWS